MKQNDDILLHRQITKHSNLMIPFSDHVTAFKFPKQNEQLLNTTVTLKYRDRHISDKEAINIPSSGRPKDDVVFTEADINKEGDDNIIFTRDFIILRADITEPYKYIAVSTDYRHIVIGKMAEDGDINTEIYPVSMLQMSEYIGLYTTNMYFAKLDLVDGVILSVDSGEPCNAVILEYIDKDTNTVRFVLGDECFSPIKGYYDLDMNIQPITCLEDLRKYDINRTSLEIMKLREYLLKDINIWIPEENIISDDIEKDDKVNEEISDI